MLSLNASVVPGATALKSVLFCTTGWPQVGWKNFTVFRSGSSGTPNVLNTFALMVAAIPHQFARLEAPLPRAPTPLFRQKALVNREFFEILFHKARMPFKQFLQALCRRFERLRQVGPSALADRG
jgi:hypothetical protein